MKHIIRNGFLGAAAVIMPLVAGCKGNEKKGAEAMSPEQTVEAFCRAVAAGDIDEAMVLCDTMAMKGYIESYIKAWNMQTKADSSAATIAAAVLAEAEFTVDEVVKEGDRRHILYMIDAGNGLKKEKKATVRKEEGVWIVEQITDRI